jgi:HSP20 family protein
MASGEEETVIAGNHHHTIVARVLADRRDGQKPHVPTGDKIMNTLNRWNQFRQLEALQHGLGSLFNRSSTPWPEGQEEQIAVPEWAPLVDISEDDKEYLIKAELPEVNKEDVKVTAEAGTLTITGNRKFETEQKGRKYHRVERSYGTFVRNFSLPDDVGPSQVSAQFKDGVLTVHLAKAERAKPQQIEVKVG